MKVLINTCYGGFELSHKAIMRYAELKGIKLWAFSTKLTSFLNYYTHPNPSSLSQEEKNTHYWSYNFYDPTNRSDPILIQVVEELGEEANGDYAKLQIVNIPKGTQFRIDEHGGKESIEYATSVDWLIAT